MLLKMHKSVDGWQCLPISNHIAYMQLICLLGVEKCILYLAWTILILQFGGCNKRTNPLVLSLVALCQTCSPEINVDQYKKDRIYLQELHRMVIKTDK